MLPGGGALFGFYGVVWLLWRGSVMPTNQSGGDMSFIPSHWCKSVDTKLEVIEKDHNELSKAFNSMANDINIIKNEQNRFTSITVELDKVVIKLTEIAANLQSVFAVCDRLQREIDTVANDVKRSDDIKFNRIRVMEDKINTNSLDHSQLIAVNTTQIKLAKWFFGVTLSAFFSLIAGITVLLVKNII